ncbi:hypothetical protein GOM49_09600 [Clostridium bovifaecis]|uniref:histidine kinase n=1 Tax=Clostridium bovifaecis TaxID=2184719 RepID=A0A6I6F4K2_9CLOT|nr:hypothetical protein GOM49_09600 [Clostridium bovifaecis]
MYEIYDHLPFGVVILNGRDLSVEYSNLAFSKIFNAQIKSLEKDIEKIIGLNNVKDILKGCFEDKINKKLRRINIMTDKYFDFIINPKEQVLEIYIYDVTEYVNEENKIKRGRDRFLNIWSEMKTKCDIMQQLRIKEKEYILHLKDVVHNMSEGLVVLDCYGKLDFCNKPAIELGNLTLEQIATAKEFFTYMDENNFADNKESLQRLYAKYIEELKPIHSFIVKLRDKSKDDFKYIELSCNPVIDKDDILINTIITINDVTEIKNNEIKLERQAKELETISKTKDEFFNMVSHELRTPLTIIQASIQLANDVYRDEISSNIGKILLKVNQSCRILLKLINNILDISKAEAGFLKVDNSPFDIVSVTENIVSSANFYAKSKGINLIFDTTEEEAIVYLDKDKYEKIILNLLSNAIKFTPEGKNITVATNMGKGYAEVKVEDEGVGIPDEKLGEIFNRFVQITNPLSNNSQGTGLGLALVKKLIDLMDGEIEVKSRLGIGTKFIIRFKIHSNNYIHTSSSFQLDSNIDNKVILEFSDIN